MSLSLSGPLTVTSSSQFNLGLNEFTIEWWQYGTSAGTGNIITVGNFKLQKNGNHLSRFNPLLSTPTFENITNSDISFTFGNKWTNFKIIRRNNISGNDVIDLIVNNTDFYNIFTEPSLFADLDFGQGSIIIGNNTDPFQLLYNFSILTETAKFPLTALSTVPPLNDSYSYNLILYVIPIYNTTLQAKYTATGVHENDVFTSTGTYTYSANIPPGASIPISTICFVAGTPVLTDNYGYVPIDQLVQGKHTINNYKVLTVTESVTPEQHLSVIPAGSLCEGVPCADTLMSLNHSIKINGEWIKSYYVAEKLGGTYVKYNGETLYNVLLGDTDGNPVAGEMTVNNMLVETLDPDNIIAKVYLSGEENRKELITALNNMKELSSNTCKF